MPKKIFGVHGRKNYPHLFIQQIFITLLLCSRHCPRCWGYSWEQNMENPCPWGFHVLPAASLASNAGLPSSQPASSPGAVSPPSLPHPQPWASSGFPDFPSSPLAKPYLCSSTRLEYVRTSKMTSQRPAPLSPTPAPAQRASCSVISAVPLVEHLLCQAHFQRLSLIKPLLFTSPRNSSNCLQMRKLRPGWLNQ